MAKTEVRWLVGYHAVVAALEGGRAVELVWLLEGRGDRRRRRLVELARERGVPTRRVPRSRLDEIAGGVAHNGCAARTAPVALCSVADLVAAADQPGRLLLLDSPADPHNVGAALRTAAAFAVDGVILAGPSPPPLGGALAKAAAGALERIPLARVNVAADAIASLHDAGYWVFGADVEGGPLRGVRPGLRWVLCVGAEARGLRAKTRRFIDEWLAIPMAPDTDSLNLSVATGIILYELCTRSETGV